MKNTILLSLAFILGLCVIAKSSDVYPPIAIGTQIGSSTVVVVVPVGIQKSGPESHEEPSAVYGSEAFPKGLFAIPNKEAALRILKYIENPEWHGDSDEFIKAFSFNSWRKNKFFDFVNVKKGQKVYIYYPAALVVEGVVSDVSYTTSHCQYGEPKWVSPELFLQVKINLPDKFIYNMYYLAKNWPDNYRFVVVSSEKPEKQNITDINKLIDSKMIADNLNKKQLVFDIKSDGQFETLKFDTKFGSNVGDITQTTTMQLIKPTGNPLLYFWCDTSNGRYLDGEYLRGLLEYQDSIYK